MINTEFGVKEKKKQNPKTTFLPKQLPKPLFTLKVHLQSCRNGKRTIYLQKFPNAACISFLYNHVWTHSKAKASDICNLSK